MISIEQAATVGLFPVETFALICLTLPPQQTNKVPNQINKVSNHNKTRPGCFCAKDCLDSKEIVVQKQALLPKVPMFETLKMALRVAKSKF